MGQRHQLFVIAKINSRYRNLYAAHHQWLYGHTAIQRCLGTIEIFQDFANRTPLQTELKYAKDHDKSIWLEENEGYWDRNDYEVKFPFIATCLTLGAAFALDGYFHNVRTEPFGMPYDCGDNNNGITIFDITNLDDVRYCFVDFYGMESEREVQLMSPLSADTYLRAYYDLEDPKTAALNAQPALDRFKGCTLVSVATLRDTWPEGDWEEPETNNASGHEDASKELPESALETTMMTSLRQLSLETVLEHLTDPTEEDLDILGGLDSYPDFRSSLKRKLVANAQAIHSSSHLIKVVVKALELDTDVDLRHFKTLPAQDLSLVVSKLRDRSNMASLNLSDRPDLKEDELLQVLGPTSVCRLVYLLHNDHISLKFLGAHLSQYDILHSSLLRRLFIRQYRDPHPSGQVEFLKQNDLAQIVWVGVPESAATNSEYRLSNGQVKWDTLELTSGGDYWITTLEYRQWVINDTPLHVEKAVNGLLRLLRWCSAAYSLPKDINHGAACAFATSSSIGAFDHGVGTISPGLYGDPSRNTYDKTVPVACVDAGQWALILVHEAYDAEDQMSLDESRRKHIEQLSDDQERSDGKEVPHAIKRLRYALVRLLPESESSSPEKRFEVAEASTYIREVMSIKGREKATIDEWIAHWDRHIAGTDASFYDENDIHTILDKVYSADAPAGSTGDDHSAPL